MSDNKDWRRIQISTLILGRIDTFKCRATRMFSLGQTAKGNDLLKIAGEWERLLNQFKAAEIRWPESGGEGS